MEPRRGPSGVWHIYHEAPGSNLETEHDLHWNVGVLDQGLQAQVHIRPGGPCSSSLRGPCCSARGKLSRSGSPDTGSSEQLETQSLM